jgi:hypothetical protein
VSEGPYDDRPDTAAKPVINRIDRREQMLGFAGSAVAAVAFLAIWIPQLGSKVPKGQVPPSTSLIIGLVLAASLALATLTKRRALVGFVALFLGFASPWNKYVIFQLAYMALAAWLLVKAFRVSQDAAKARKEQSASGGSLGPRKAPATSRRGASTSAKRGRSGSAAGSKRPTEANKRYTPPAPKRPRPGRTAAKS